MMHVLSFDLLGGPDHFEERQKQVLILLLRPVSQSFQKAACIMYQLHLLGAASMMAEILLVQPGPVSVMSAVVKDFVVSLLETAIATTWPHVFPEAWGSLEHLGMQMSRLTLLNTTHIALPSPPFPLHTGLKGLGRLTQICPGHVGIGPPAFRSLGISKVKKQV